MSYQVNVRDSSTRLLCKRSGRSITSAPQSKTEKKVAISLRLCVSSLHRDHANLLCIFSCLFNARSEDRATFHTQFDNIGTQRIFIITYTILYTIHTNTLIYYRQQTHIITLTTILPFLLYQLLLC